MTEDQVAVVESAGQAQVTAIQTKGDEVLNSLPQDYTELSDDVGVLKSAIGELPKLAETEEDTADLYVADSQGNVIVQFSNGHIQTKNFNSAELKEQGIEWKFSGNDLFISYGYNGTIDAVVVLNEGRANGLFDFAKLCSKPKGTSLAGLETADLTVIWNSSTDMHGPFQFLAVNNADGYHADATDPGFTGAITRSTIRAVTGKRPHQKA